MTLFLTADELADLTGYRQPKRQMEWLRAHGWIYEVSAKGHPRVARRHFETMMDKATVEGSREPQLRLSS